MTARDGRPPLIVHVVHRFAVGGMENGIVNLLNNLPTAFADHAIVALTDADAGFAARLRRGDVRIIALHKPEGQTARILPRLYGLLRRLAPAVVHTRNVGTLEAQLAAWAAGVPVRIHGEHGWDVGDLGGTNQRMLWLRRVMKAFVHHQAALSTPTQRYLVERVGVAAQRVSNICNGVDTERFHPARATLEATHAAEDDARRADVSGGALAPGDFVVGAVGRVAAVKNVPMLVDAFARVSRRNPAFERSARLAIVGDGPELDRVRARIDETGLRARAWLPGGRDDVPDCLRCLDVLCLPSLVEGISNTVLEAMACGLPVIATEVGGNAELVDAGVSGVLVRSGDVEALADAIERYFTDPALRLAHARQARQRAVTQFSLATMVEQYHRLYANQLLRCGIGQQAAADRISARPGA